MIMRQLLLTLVAIVLLIAGQVRAREPVADFGLMLNEDGDAIFIAGPDPDPAVSAQKLEALLDDLKGRPVRTLVYNIACGSDILHYPSKAGSTWGWRTCAREKAKPWDTYLPGLRAATAAGFDSVRVAATWSKRNGLLFVPSYRMNDSHYCNNPQDNVLTGRFWVENQPRVTLGASPVAGIENLKDLLNFTHPAVRAYRLSIIREAAERYADVMDGFQLDFMRQPALFPAGEVTSQQAALVTELVADVRKELDELGAKAGRRIPLMVRVPATLMHCRKARIDVPAWIRRGLVDVVTPSQAMTLAHDMPVDEFVQLAKPVGVKVYPALLDRTQFAWPFVGSPTAESYAGTVSWDTAGQLARGTAANYRAMGADGIELYNFNVPLSAPSIETVLAAADADPAARGERVYAVTSRYMSDQLDLYDRPRALPARLCPGRPVMLRLYVGEDVAKAKAPPLTCALRIGIWLGGKPAESLGAMTVKLNGKAVLSGSPVERFTAVAGKQTRTSKHVPPPVEGYVQIPLDGAAMRSNLKKGWNEIFIEAATADAQTKYTLCEVAVGVLPAGAP
jgi:hypothetical protein